MLGNVKVVLIGTTHSGNIGSAARAMKVMGLTQMVLVAPKCQVDAQAIALAAGASEIALNAECVDSLDEAVGDCALVIGSSARTRSLKWAMLTPKECGELCVTHGVGGDNVALVFGRENTGLTNEELQKCHYHVSIPANPEYSSLNLAMAVQTFCYEVRMAYLSRLQNSSSVTEEQTKSQHDTYPPHKELEMFYAHLENILIKTQFISESQPGKVMNKLRRFFGRAHPETQELNMLRGILTSIEKVQK